jgi:hypothetical protein
MMIISKTPGTVFRTTVVTDAFDRQEVPCFFRISAGQRPFRLPKDFICRRKADLVNQTVFSDTSGPTGPDVEPRGGIMNHFRSMRLVSLLAVSMVICCGCGWHAGGHGWHHGLHTPAAAQIKNPMYVALSDREFLWNQLVATIDDDFKIEREERVRLVGGVLTEGRIETFPQIGSTLLEPWRTDSTPGFEKLYATVNSMRRRAVVRVMPQTDGGYLVEVAVYKELEDVAQPEFSTVDSEALRHDGTLRRPRAGGRYSSAANLGWIPLGRDTSLEQRILAKLRARLGVIAEG